MEINVLYNASKMLADKVKKERPNYVVDPASSLCLIITDKDEIFIRKDELSLDLDITKDARTYDEVRFG